MESMSEVSAISVLGLGYVGSVTCACLASGGRQVIGVDVNPVKIAAINDGHSPVIEDGVEERIAESVGAGRLSATDDAAYAINATDISLVAVGTPSRPDGSVDLGAMLSVCGEIGTALRDKPSRHLVVIRSTVPPGTCRKVIVPAIEEAAGKPVGTGFGLCFNPEFLREGCALKDFADPAFTLVGGDDADDSQRVADLYEKVSGERLFSTLETAEMVKYVCNTFHALKVTFANEIGILAREIGVDGPEVMRLMCRDAKLNISPAYLRPGFAFGGSCLPKDLRGLLHHAHEKHLEVPLLDSMLRSNQWQVQRAIDRVLGLEGRKVSIFGLSFKSGTDDLRESPLVAVVEALLGKGYEVRIYDRNVSLAKLVGANRELILREIPHLAALMTDDFSEAVRHSDTLIVGNNDPAFEALATQAGAHQTIVDLAGMTTLASGQAGRYIGIAW